jgi:hypothetical protein
VAWSATDGAETMRRDGDSGKHDGERHRLARL